MADKGKQIHQPTSLFISTPLYRRDYFVCTGCSAYSCGGLYVSLCEDCNGVTTDPPRNIRHQYLCTDCARRRPVCNCKSTPVKVKKPVDVIYRNPPEYCWCSCCTCCTYTCSCKCCGFFCECLSATCGRFEPCCYCTRLCCGGGTCCKPRLCFWSWCKCLCSPP